MNQDNLINAMRGAVDLSVFNRDSGQREKDRPNSAPAQDALPAPLIDTVTEQTLPDALALSVKVPIVAVIHGADSASSRKLTELMKKLAAEFSGRFGVRMISADTQPRVAAMLGVQAVPAAVAFLQQQPIALFQGVPEENVLRQTLGRLLEAAAKYGITGVLATDSDSGEEAAQGEAELPPLHKEGFAALEAGDLQLAHDKFAQAVSENPHDTEARHELLRVELLQRMGKISAEQDVKLFRKILAESKNVPLSEFETHLQAADIEVACGHPEAGFRRLTDVIRELSGDERETVRKRLLDLFCVAGENTPQVREARKALANALF